MTFKELKQGQILYVFNRTNANISRCEILSVSQPHMLNNMNYQYGQSPEMVVDIDVSDNGNRVIYQFNESSEIGFTADIAVSPNKQKIIDEINSLEAQCEKTLKEAETCHDKIDKCHKIKAELDPAVKEKQKTEERFTKLETSVSDMKGSMDEIKNMLKELTNK